MSASLQSPGIKQKTYGSLSEINVTPLVDVILVLLIIFMVTAPMMHAGVDVDLPSTTTSSQETAEERVLVSVTAEKQLYVGDRRVSYQMLTERVRQQLGPHAPSVALRADRKLPYGYILHVIDAIRQAGVENVGLIVNPVELPEESGPEAGSGDAGG
jgi:biopolymer transport protein TolR